MRVFGTKPFGVAWVIVLSLLASALVVLVPATSASAAPFVATASMPTAPGVKAGEQPDGDWSIAVDQVTGAKWRVWSSGSQTGVQGPNGIASATWAGQPGDFQANIKYLAVDSGNHHAFATGPTNTEIVEFDGTAVNIRTNVVRTALPTGVTGFTELAVNSVTHNVYLVNSGRNSVYEFVPSTSQWTEIVLPAGSAPAMVAADEANNLIYVTNSGTSSLSVIDPASHTVVNTVPVGATPWGISIDNVHQLAYVANSGGSTISVLDISTASAVVSSTLSFSTYAPKFVSIDTTNLFLYVGSTTSGVAVVDIQAGNVVNEVNGYGSSIWSLAADPINRLAYYSTRSVSQPGYYFSNVIGYIPEITSGPPADGIVGTVYPGHQMTAIGSATITFSKTSGTLPPGLSINSAGAISGTPTTPGLFTFTITADNGYGTDSETYSIHIPTPPPVLSATTLVDGYVSEAYVPDNSGCWFNCPAYVKVTSTWLGSSYAATGIDPFRVTTGTIPAGLTLNGATGEFSGTPTTAGTYTFTITGTNSTLAPVNPATQTTTQQYTIVIQPARPPIIDPALDWDVNWQLGSSPTPPYEGGGNSWTQWMSPYLATGSPSATWSISAGALPAGLSFNAGNPSINGQVTALAGTAYSFTLRATGANGLYAERTFSGVVTAAPPNFSGTNFMAFEGTPFYFDPSQSIAFYNGGSGSAPLTWSYQQSTLDQYPSGLAFNTTTGVVSGTPAAGTSTGGATGFYSIDMDVTNAVGASHPNYSLSVQPALPASQKQTITMAEGVTLTSGSTYPTVPVAGIAPGGSPYWQPQLGSHIPSWLTIDDSNNGNGTGEMTGTAPSGSAGDYVMVMQYYDNNWNPYFLEVTLTVTPAPPALAATTTINKNAGSAFSEALANSGGAADACAIANSTSAPVGVSLTVQNGTCYIDGNSSVAVGTYTFDVEASNMNGTQTSVTSVTLSIQSTPVVSSPISVTWRVGQSNTYTITPSGGATPFTYSVALGSTKPAWVTLGSSTGVVSGTPATAGSSSFDVVVTNSAGSVTVTVNITAMVAPTVPATTNIAAPVVGTPYSHQLAAPTAGTAPFTYAVASGSLPAGLSLNTSTGLISGTPTTAGAASFTISVTNGLGANHAASTSISTTVVLPPAPVMAATTTISKPGGAAFTQAIANTGGDATACALANSTTLPTGVTLSLTSGDCVLDGTNAVVVGVYTFDVEASNLSGAQTAVTSVTLNILAAPVVTNPITLNWRVGQANTYTITPTAGATPFTYAVAGGSTKPAWVTLGASTGVVSGTPTTASSYSFNVVVTNAAGTATTTVSITTLVAPVVPATTSIVAPTVGLAYSHQLAAPTAGTGPFTYAVASGALPAGLSLNTSTGLISGTPTTPGAANFTISVTNALGANHAATTSISTTVVQTLPTYTATINRYVAVGAAVNLTQNRISGTPAVSWAVASSSTLPGWLTLDAQTGDITGTAPGSAGVFTFDVEATNGAGTSTISVTLTVQVLPTISSFSPPAPVVGVPYTYSVSPSGTGPFTYTYTGTLPAGLTFNSSTGVISGTPTGNGSSGTFTIVVNNGLSSQAGTGSASTGSRTLTSSRLAPTLAATTTVPQIGPLVTSTFAITPTGGSPVTSYSLVSSPTPPNWVSINATTGVLSFTNPPLSAIGSHTFNVRATNATGNATTAVTVVVADVPIIPSTLTYRMAVGSAWSKDISTEITGGTGPFSGWNLVGGSTLPAWLSQTGSTLSGTPVAAGTDTFTLDVSNANGTSTSQISVIAMVAPSFGSLTPPAATTGVPYTFSATASGTGPFTYSIASGSLPAGLSLNTTTGVISGTPTGSGIANFSVGVVSALGQASSASVSLAITTTVVAPAIAPTTSISATAGVSLSRSFALVSGSPATSWSAAPSVPAGLTLNPSTGAITGSPTTPGTYTFTVTGTNTSGSTQSVVTLVVAAAPVTPSNGGSSSSSGANGSGASGGSSSSTNGPSATATPGVTATPSPSASSSATSSAVAETSAGTTSPSWLWALAGGLLLLLLIALVWWFIVARRRRREKEEE